MAVFAGLVVCAEAAESVSEGFVGFGETIPFVDNEGDSDADAKHAEDGFEPEGPAGEEDKFGDANRNAAEINQAANDNDASALFFGCIRAKDSESDFDADRETGDDSSAEKRNPADDDVAAHE